MVETRFERIRNSPALYPGVAERLGERFPWHTRAGSARSSQGLCLSAWVPLADLEVRHKVVEELLKTAFATASARLHTTGSRPAVPPRVERRWDVLPEVVRPELLGEYGGGTSAIDMLVEADDAVVSVESKYLGDATAGFGRCGQFPEQCRGYHGPGSDLTGTGASCRWTDGRVRGGQRRYWTVADRLFLVQALRSQHPGDRCPMNRFYQLARNLFFAAEYARTSGRAHFAVLTIAPAATAATVEKQVATFAQEVLRPEHAGRVAVVHYERLAELLMSCGDEAAADVGRFVAARLPAAPVAPPRTTTARELRRRAETARQARRRRD